MYRPAGQIMAAARVNRRQLRASMEILLFCLALSNLIGYILLLLLALYTSFFPPSISYMYQALPLTTFFHLLLATRTKRDVEDLKI